MVPCKEPELLKEVITCKKSINLHIKMWVDGYEDMMMGIEEYMKEFIDPPIWVYNSFIKSLIRKNLKNMQV